MGGRGYERKIVTNEKGTKTIKNTLSRSVRYKGSLVRERVSLVGNKSNKK